MYARYRTFRAGFATWDALFSEAAAFASKLGPERVISISHSEDQNDGVVVVWYWSGSDTEEDAFVVHDDTEGQA